MMSLDFICLGVSFFIPQSYYVSKEMLEGKIEIVEDRNPEPDVENNNNDVPLDVNHPDVLMDDIDSSNAYPNGNHERAHSEKANLIPLEDEVESEDESHHYVTCLGYLKFGCYKYWTTPILWLLFYYFRI